MRKREQGEWVVFREGFLTTLKVLKNSTVG
jgi:hypothetical protein